MAASRWEPAASNSARSHSTTPKKASITGRNHCRPLPRPARSDSRQRIAHRPSGDFSWSDALELPMCLLHQGLRGRQLIDDALAKEGLAVTHTDIQSGRPVGPPYGDTGSGGPVHQDFCRAGHVVAHGGCSALGVAGFNRVDDVVMSLGVHVLQRTVDTGVHD